MQEKNALVVFQDKKIRRKWHENTWFFSVVDVIEALTDSNNPRNYWSMLKAREVEHEIELSTLCVQLKLPSSDGKNYETDCANTKSLFRIIQSIASPKAEPFKRWLAQTGYEKSKFSELNFHYCNMPNFLFCPVFLIKFFRLFSKA